MSQATPNCLTPEQKGEIKAIYAEARRRTAETGIKHHVDHIAPISGRNLSGLHVPWNLRVVPASQNLRKSNRVVTN